MQVDFRDATLLTAAMLAVAALAAPTAQAEPLPAPEPVPVPGTGQVETGVPAGEVQYSGTGVETSTTVSGVGETLVPNINGYPCTGGWESAVCYAMGQDSMPAVQPRSTLSSSP